MVAFKNMKRWPRKLYVTREPWVLRSQGCEDENRENWEFKTQKSGVLALNLRESSKRRDSWTFALCTNSCPMDCQVWWERKPDRRGLQRQGKTERPQMETSLKDILQNRKEPHIKEFVISGTILLIFCGPKQDLHMPKSLPGRALSLLCPWEVCWVILFLGGGGFCVGL